MESGGLCHYSTQVVKCFVICAHCIFEDTKIEAEKLFYARGIA